MMSIMSCNFLKEKTPTKITEDYLLGKDFIANKNAIMGRKHFRFKDSSNVSYLIADKTAYGYNGKYTFEYDSKGNQFIKIVEKENKLIVVLLVKSAAKLEVFSVEPKIYKYPRFPYFNIEHQIGKTYGLNNR